MDPLIICCALTGSLPTRERNPSLPLTPRQIGEDAARCESAGCSLVHVHARDAQGHPNSDGALFTEIVAEVGARSSVIVMVSTGGRASQTLQARSACLEAGSEMASLTCGSVNFSDQAYVNQPALVEGLAKGMLERSIKPELEAFDVSHIDGAVRLWERGLLSAPLHFQLVLGLPGAIPAGVANYLHMVAALPPGATHSVAAVGAWQLPMTTLATLAGGHARVGLEDNLYYARGDLASNPRLVERCARISSELGREVATPAQARAVLSLGASVSEAAPRRHG